MGVHSTQVGDLHLWQWPQYLVLFGLGVVGLGGVRTADFFGGWHWAALATAAAEGITVSVWLLGLAQRRLAAGNRTAGRNAYAAFLVQGHVLVGLALAVRPFALPAEVKVLAVGVPGAVLSFALGWLLISRTPLGRLL